MFGDRKVPDQTPPKSRFQTLSCFSLCVTSARTATGWVAARRSKDRKVSANLTFSRRFGDERYADLK